jgi:excisionase family DNA binding protein
MTLLDIKGIATYLSVPVKTVYGLVQLDTFPAAKIGKHWLSHPESLNRWALERINSRIDTLIPN